MKLFSNTTFAYKNKKPLQIFQEKVHLEDDLNNCK